MQTVSHNRPGPASAIRHQVQDVGSLVTKELFDCSIGAAESPAPAMRNEDRLRNEANKSFVFTLPVHRGVREK
jgi:hypothetical protein